MSAYIISENNRRWHLVSDLLLGKGAEVMREVFRSAWQNYFGRSWDMADCTYSIGNRTRLTCGLYFHERERNGVEKNLTLSQLQWKLIKDGDIDQWDVTLLSAILRYSVFSLATGLLSEPQRQAVFRLTDSRNFVIGHISDPTISQVDFDKYVHQAVNDLNILKGGVVTTVDAVRGRVLTDADIDSVDRLRAEMRTPIGHLKMWLDSHFQSIALKGEIPTEIPTAGEFRSQTYGDVSSVLHIAGSDSSLPARIWFDIATSDTDQHSTPAAYAGAEVIFGSEGKMRAALEAAEVGRRIEGSVPDKRWLIGLDVPRDVMSAEHIRVSFDDHLKAWTACVISGSGAIYFGEAGAIALKKKRKSDGPFQLSEGGRIATSDQKSFFITVRIRLPPPPVAAAELPTPAPSLAVASSESERTLDEEGVAGLSLS